MILVSTDLVDPSVANGLFSAIVSVLLLGLPTVSGDSGAVDDIP
jgi:hypothetical protein